MNLWASSAANSYNYNKSPVPYNTNWSTYAANPPFMDTFWNLRTNGCTNLILFTEEYETTSTPGVGLTCSATAGFKVPAASNSAGTRFLGTPSCAMSTYTGAVATTELDYTRHRRSQDAGAGLKAKGQINVAFADGHVQLMASDALADSTTGLSKLVALWSPYDVYNR